MRIDQLPITATAENTDSLAISNEGISKQLLIGSLATAIRDDVYGAPLTAATAAAMTDTTRIYVYTGSETGYTAGHWYYYDGSAWADGGVYNSVAVQTDATLTLAGVPADAAAVGTALAGKVAIQQGSGNAGKALVVGDDGSVTLGEAGVPQAVADALLNLLRKVAYVDGTGQALYEALEAALGGGGTGLLYELAQPTLFTSSSSYIDTDVTPEVGGIYTILVEYASDVLNSDIRAVYGAISAYSTVATQLNHNGSGNDIVWGVGQSWQDRTNAARGAVARHAIVLDLTGDNESGYAWAIHEYRNLSKGWSESYDRRFDALSAFAGIDSFKVGGSTHANLHGFQGLISEFKLYNRALSDAEIGAFLTAIPESSFGSDVEYELPAITAFDGTNQIDTGISLASDSVKTVLIEYEPTTLDTGSDNVTHFVLSYTHTGASGNAIQVSHLIVQNKDVTWGYGLSWQSSQSNAGINNVMRDVLVFDTRSGAAASGKYLCKRYYLNQTLNVNSSTSVEYDIDSATYTDTFWIGARGDMPANTAKFKGRVVSCRVIDREPTQEEREQFLKYGR